MSIELDIKSMTMEQKKKAHDLLQAKADKFAYAENLTPEQEDIYGQIKDALDVLQKADGPPRRMTVQNNVDLLTGQHIQTNPGSGQPYALRTPQAKKDYNSLFGRTGQQWDEKDGGFFNAVLSGRHDPRLIKNDAMTIGTPSDGGFLVPTQYAEQIHNVSLENELVLPRCYVQPMTSNECKIPAMTIGDHSTALMGGFTASYTAETGTISENNPKTRQMSLIAKKLTGLLRFSGELAEDMPGNENQIINLCGRGLSWYRDRYFLKGTGAGQPQGVLRSDCLIEVDPETGQDANTIVYSNLTQMMSRMFAGSFNNSVWVCHQSTIPQLLQLSVDTALTGHHIPVMSETDGQFRMLTRPVIFTEKTETLGTKGDIMLIDFSQYVVGLRGQMRFDTSIHPGFLTDEIYARIIERHDGQSLWSEALTLADGSTTVSPFVTLADR